MRWSTMKIFFDSEFTALSSDPRLISIGMVAENGSQLYIELTDGWSEENCSAWVREHVVPLLGKGDKCTRAEAGKRIFSWLSFAEYPPTLLSDSDWDTTLLAELMNECSIPRERYHLEVLEYKTKIQAKAFEEARLRHFQSMNLVQHYALHDAQVFHAAWVSVFGADASHADSIASSENGPD